MEVGLHTTKTVDGSGSGITAADHIGNLNPLRYRGYYYDTETGLYYVQSRYYDAEVGRWVNPDSMISGNGGSLHGYNMFAYCFNNPVAMRDDTGEWPKWVDTAKNWVNNEIINPAKKFIRKL